MVAMRTRRLMTLLLLAALVLPGVLCVAAEASVGPSGCCPPGDPDAPAHMRACCPSEDGTPATAGPTSSGVVSGPATASALVSPIAIRVRDARRPNASPIAPVPIRLLTSVFLI